MKRLLSTSAALAAVWLLLALFLCTGCTHGNHDRLTCLTAEQRARCQGITAGLPSCDLPACAQPSPKPCEDGQGNHHDCD